ncbi:AMP-binding protein [Streptomyces caelestis]|uniref:AMP-binding protein n=1 Tax=Streptomyces caelestis TaxID=36816 RepID=UPI00382EAB97
MGRADRLPPGARAWTHGEVHDLAARAATVLAGHGVRPGDRVLLALPGSLAWVTAFLATARLGAVAVLVDPELPATDHAFCRGHRGRAPRVGAGPGGTVHRTGPPGRRHHLLGVLPHFGSPLVLIPDPGTGGGGPAAGPAPARQCGDAPQHVRAAGGAGRRAR